MHRYKQLVLKKGSPLSRIAAVMIAVVIGVCVFSIPAAAQNTYRITDGDRVMIFSSGATDPADVLNEAGLTLGKDDTYTTMQSDDYSEIHVKRIQMVTINDAGHILKTGTYGETVEELLTRLDIAVGEDDLLSVEPMAQTEDGMTIAIDRRTFQNETHTRAVGYETEFVYDDSLAVGEEEVVTAGVDGEEQVEERITYVNGEESERAVLNTKVLREPVTEQIRIGTGVEPIPISEKDLHIADGVITLGTGETLNYNEVRTMLATGYSCEGWSEPGITATGTVARVGAIAVDPTVIPYGTRMFIVSNDGQYIYGVATAEDCGNPDYIGGNRIDLYFDTVAECIQFGARNCQVYILG